MEKVIIASIIVIAILAGAACGGSAATPLPTATTAPTPTPQPTIPVSLSSEDVGSVDADVLVCLTERLGESVAKVVTSGLIPHTDEESAILGECVLSASTAAFNGRVDPIVTCLEKDLGADLARAVVSGAIPLTVMQETLLGNCGLAISLGSGSTALSVGMEDCLEAILGAESAQMVASSAGAQTEAQQAALGSCLFSSALGGTDSTAVSSGVLACLTEELGAEVAQVVASSVLPLNADEEQILGNCVLKDALGLAP